MGADGRTRYGLSTLTVLVSGTVATAAIAVVGELVSLLILASKVIPGDTLTQALKRGLLFVYLFTHVGMKMSTTALHLPRGADKTIGLPSGFQLTASFAFALMLGTALVIVCFFVAGRFTGRVAGGSWWHRALWGAATSLPFAAAAGAVAYSFVLHLELPHTSAFIVHIARRGAFFWPLVLGALSGAWGGLRSTPRVQLDEWLTMHVLDKSRARWRGAFAGARRMVVLGMGLSFLSLLFYALLDPSAARAYFGAASGHGVLGLLTVVLLTLLALPNIATWILLPAMGGCLDVGGGISLVPPGPYCFLGYTHTISHRLPTVNHEWAFVHFHNLGALPAIYLLFLLVPLVATMAGGAHAARVAGATTGRNAAVVGALTGLVFAGFVTAVLAVALTTVTTLGPDPMANQYFRYGPYPAYGLQLALAWGVGGGLLGAISEVRRARGR